MPPSPDSKNRLLVEGKDDSAVVRHLLMRHDVDWESDSPALPYIHDCEGLDALFASIQTSAKTYHRLGLLVDVDVDATERWGRLRATLNAIGVNLPDAPEQDGTVVNGMFSGTRVGVWLMPDNRSQGRLEDFLGRLVAHDDACWPYAGEATERARELGAGFSETDQPKARIHTWLAWQERPGCPFGTAITACYFRHDSEEALRFVAWFRRLFLE